MTREKYMPEEKRQNRNYYNQEEWLEEFLDNEGAFYNGSESGYSENDENYIMKICKQLFADVLQNR